MANWATTADVLAITGQSVTDAQITIAQGVMDVFSGTQIEAEANLTTRDRRLLRYATAYQTVWQIEQVDVLSRTDVKRIQQDAMDVEPADADALILAPLAARCLAKLSWRRSRSVRVSSRRPRYVNLEAYHAAVLRDEAPAGQWAPL